MAKKLTPKKAAPSKKAATQMSKNITGKASRLPNQFTAGGLGTQRPASGLGTQRPASGINKFND